MEVYLKTRVVSCQKNECDRKRNHCGSSPSWSNSTFVKYNHFYTCAMAIESILKMKHCEIKWRKASYTLNGRLGNLLPTWDLSVGTGRLSARSTAQGIVPTKQDTWSPHTWIPQKQKKRRGEQWVLWLDHPCCVLPNAQQLISACLKPSWKANKLVKHSAGK